MGVLKPELIFKSIVPIIMAGILGIYGLIVAVILNGKSKSPAPDRLIIIFDDPPGVSEGLLRA
jgi:ATP synthase proteolipid subunit